MNHLRPFPRYNWHRSASLLLSLSLSGAVVAACGSSGTADQSSSADGSSAQGGAGGSTGKGAAGSSGAAPEGVPCEVAQVLEDHCWSCHGATPKGGASVSLVTYADLMAPSKADPKKKEIELALERMKDASKPMPPGSGVSVPASQIAAVSSWVGAGEPKGSCGGGAGGAGGSAGAGGKAAGGSGQAGAPPAATGLPCDVAKVLGTYCVSCHGSPPTGGAPMPLVTYDDVMKPWAKDPSKRLIDVSLARMQDAASPMPPGNGISVPVADIGAVSVWIAGGEPKGDCSGASGGAGGSSGSGGAGAGGQAGAPAAVGVPCDVSQVLAEHCLSCHGAVPSGGASVSLVSYADLMSPSKSDPTKKEIELAVARMQDAASPMPPGPTVTVPAAQVAVLQAWITAGEPMGNECGAAGAGGSAGGGGSPANDPLNAQPTCTSGKTYDPNTNPVDPNQDGDGASFMRPGEACLTCHGVGAGQVDWDKQFVVAGTLYPTGHEPQYCSSGSTPAVTDVTIHVQDGDGKGTEYKLKATKSGAGNFYLYASDAPGFTPPYKAWLTTADGKLRAMSAHQSDGDCNGCHTQTGTNGAPGRVTAPY